jgi:hypothetical protein
METGGRDSTYPQDCFPLLKVLNTCCCTRPQSSSLTMLRCPAQGFTPVKIPSGNFKLRLTPGNGRGPRS